MNMGKMLEDANKIMAEIWPVESGPAPEFFMRTGQVSEMSPMLYAFLNIQNSFAIVVPTEVNETVIRGRLIHTLDELRTKISEVLDKLGVDTANDQVVDDAPEAAEEAEPEVTDIDDEQ